MKLLRMFRSLRSPGDAYALGKRAEGGPVAGGLVVNGVLVVTGSAMNDLLYSAADVLGRILGGQSGYRIGAMYFEFIKNGTTWAAPAVDPSDVTYFASVRSTPGDTDFLRVPLDVTPAWTATTSDYESNLVRFFAQTSDNVGQRELASPGTGLTFTDGDWIVGGGLVATPTASVADDVVFSRFYFDEAARIQKLSGLQAGLTWPIKFQ